MMMAAREKLSIPEHRWNEASAALCEYDSINEAAVISTCNRFEIYLVAEDHYAAARDAMAYLKEHSQLDDKSLRPNLFMLLNSDAVWHLLHVASGLDSLVIGEGQILSQVKACYSHAIAPAFIFLWLVNIQINGATIAKGTVNGT